jgi:7-cyano-7-deazaguanine synthase
MIRDPRAVVLLSGGLDSSTVAHIVKHRGFDVYALSFRYGQRHEFELEAARRVAKRVGALSHEVVNIDLRVFGGSALTGDIQVPKGRAAEDIASGIPVTYVPARNTIFLSFAMGWAEVLQSSDVFIGVNAIDYSGYPDCRPEFIAAFQQMARLATKVSVEGTTTLTIHAPLMQMNKADIIRRGLELGVDYSLTHTCYDPDVQGQACGGCDACLLRLRGFADVGVPDPVAYQTEGAPSS